jgi:tetratricopeptide (TPR) repeat protein
MHRMQRQTPPAPGKHGATVRVRGKRLGLAEACALAAQEQKLGNFQAAVDIYNAVLPLVPGVAALHINRGFALQELKRYDDALASFDKAIALNSNQAEAYNNRGAVLQKLNRLADALASYDRAIALKPDYANAHHNRGSILKKLKRHDEALASFDRAIALNPGRADFHNNRAVTLQELKRTDEAITGFDQALALNPHFAEAWNNRGLSFLIKGNMPEAEQMFLKAFGLKPDFSEALFNLTTIRKYADAENADINNILNLLCQPGISREDQEHLLFSLGKIYDDCSRYEEAFKNYQQANQIRNAAVAYDANQVTRTTNDLIEVFSRDFLARPFAFASDSSSPLFIVGMPCSGTTLLANILSNHRAIATAGELPTLTDLTLRLPDLIGGGMPYPQAATQITPAAAATVIHDYEQRLRRDFGSEVPHVIDKNPLNFKNLGLISMLFPKARIIHCTRDPMDTGLSNYFQRFPLHLAYCFDLRNIGHFYTEYARLMEHWRTVLPVKLVEISYEDMVMNTKQTARKALDLLGLEWDERCLSPHTNPCAVETASQWQVRQPIYHQSVGRWRHYETHLEP